MDDVVQGPPLPRGQWYSLSVQLMVVARNQRCVKLLSNCMAPFLHVKVPVKDQLDAPDWFRPAMIMMHTFLPAWGSSSALQQHVQLVRANCTGSNIWPTFCWLQVHHVPQCSLSPLLPFEWQFMIHICTMGSLHVTLGSPADSPSQCIAWITQRLVLQVGRRGVRGRDGPAIKLGPALVLPPPPTSFSPTPLPLSLSPPF